MSLDGVLGGLPNLERAACIGHPEPSIFFSDNVHDHRAKQVCRGCRVRKACLDYALARPERHGIWGGTNSNERQALLDEQGRSLAEADRLRRRPAEHGTRSRYVRGCRCEPCRGAQRAYAQSRRLLPV